MPLFRCLECAGEFEAAKPICEMCGIDASKKPRDAGVIVTLELIHYDPPTSRPGQGVNHAACDPKIRIGAPKCGFTGEPVAVTCAKCKASELYVAANGVSNGAKRIPVGPVKTSG